MASSVTYYVMLELNSHIHYSIDGCKSAKNKSNSCCPLHEPSHLGYRRNWMECVVGFNLNCCPHDTWFVVTCDVVIVFHYIPVHGCPFGQRQEMQIFIMYPFCDDGGLGWETQYMVLTTVMKTAGNGVLFLLRLCRGFVIFTFTSIFFQHTTILKMRTKGYVT